MSYCISCPEEGYIPQQSVKIYVEDRFYPQVNALISQYYDQIQENMGNEGDGLLLYLPMLWEETPDELMEYITGHHADQLTPLKTVDALRLIWPAEVVDQIKGAGYLQYTMGYSGHQWIRGLNFTPLADGDQPNSTLLAMAGLEEWTPVEEESAGTEAAENPETVEEPEQGMPVFDAAQWEEDDLTMKHASDALAEGHITDEQKEKLNTLIENSRDLIRGGLSIQMIRILAQAQNKLSPLQITEDYRILLPEFNNMEIPLKPLQRAMFIVFQNYPEGVSKADMANLKDEIYAIYRKTSDKWNIIKLKSNVKALCDENGTTFEDKCHAMRRQFLARLDETIACHYLPVIK